MAPLLRHVATPVVGFSLFNTAIVAIHWPEAVAFQNTTEWAHFLIHVAFFLTALLLWLPVFSPTRALPRLSRPGSMLYISVNTLIPIVPASLLTFSSVQLYPVYGDAGLSWGLTAVEDQTIAGIIMKIGGAFYLLGIIGWIWFDWIRDERRFDEIEREFVG